MRLELLATQLDDEERLIARSRISRRQIKAYGDVVGDYTLIHRSKRAARQHDFKTTPVIGTHITGIGMYLCECLSPEREPTIVTSFERPVYPRDCMDWYAHRNGEEIRLILRQNGHDKVHLVQSPGKREIPETGCKLGEVELEIKENEIAKIGKLTGGLHSQAKKYSFPQALIPALTTRYIQQMIPDIHAFHLRSEGVNHHPLEPGAIRIALYAGKSRALKRGWLHRLRGEIYQGGKHITSAMIGSMTNAEIDVVEMQRLMETNRRAYQHDNGTVVRQYPLPS